MALITCPECGNNVSDKANACPKCGCPIESIISRLQVQEHDESETQQVAQDAPLGENPAIIVQLNSEEHRSPKKKRIILSICATIVAAAIAVALLFATRGSKGIVGRWRTKLTESVVAEYEFTKDGNFISYAGESDDTIIMMAHGTYRIKDGQVLIDMPQSTGEEYNDYSIVNGKLQLYGQEWERVK